MSFIPPWSKAQLTHARDLFRAGVAIHRIGAAMNCSRQVATKRLIEAGIYKPASGASPRPWTDDERRKLDTMRARGMSREAIATALGRSIASISNVAGYSAVHDGAIWRGARLGAATEGAFAEALKGARYVDHPRSLRERIAPPSFSQPILADTTSRGCALAWCIR